MATAESSTARLPDMRALMSLRFVAAVGVFLLHVSFFTQASLYAGVPDVRLPDWMQLLREVYYRQTFFFVLSGFTLAYVYHRRLANPTRSQTFRFWRARIARIWPLHVAFVLVMIPTLHREFRSTPLETLGALASHLTLTQSWFSAVTLSSVDPDFPLTFTHAFNPPAWALSCELLMYAAFPAVLWLLVSKWNLRARWLATFAGGVWLVILGLGISLNDASLATVTHWLYEFPPTRLLDFIIGVCMGVAFAKHRSISGALRKTPPGWIAAWTVAEVAVLALVVVSIAFRDTLPISIRISALYTPIMAAIIWTFAFDRGLISRLLWPRPFQYLGKVSFAFYLAHLPVMIYLGKVFGFNATSIREAAVAFVICLGVAIGAHHFIENPMRRVIRGEKKLAGSAQATA